VKKILKSTCNVFGLFCQYYATHFPDHDPERNSDFSMDTSLDFPSRLSVNSYYPYPNNSSFLLGEWYWNDGIRKLESNFMNLLKIIGHPDFQPQDIARTNWCCVNAQLGRDLHGGILNDEDHEGSKNGWEDEQVSSDWIKTPIKIKVPFHKCTLHPGIEEFEAGKLHHHKLVSVIREKIMRPSSHPHFHFEPYKLFWQPSKTSDPVKVHGELYSSEAFIDTHCVLQESSGEQGCQLSRVIVGLMFASDGTHLTAFSNAKLWPVYLAFRNELKDRRSRPSCHAFKHIVYFETVTTASLVACYVWNSDI
jgi:Plavaka transposase